MKVSTKGRYGLRALVDLAIHSSTGHESLHKIAERQEMSLNYLEQVFSVLRKSGFVKSVKGAQGGYILGLEPGNIKVIDVLEALEGEINVVDYIEQDQTEYQQLLRRCIQESVWDKMNETLNEVFGDVTLQDLIEEYNQGNDPEALMYYI